MSRSTLIRTALAGGVAAAGLTVGGVAIASAEDTATADRVVAAHRGPGDLAAELADELGLEEAAVADALEAVHDELDVDVDRAEAPAPPTEEEVEERQAAFAEALAAELDVDAADVTAALEALHAEHEADARDGLAERLDQAVEDGDLTAADKASVLKAFDAGVLGGPGGGMGPGGHGGPGGPGGR